MKFNEEQQKEFDRIIADILSKDIDFSDFAAEPFEEVASWHHGAGTWIRNEYGLWHTSILTERWRTDPSSHDIRDGVDYSEDHPDQMSSLILEGLWKRLNQK